MTQLPARIDELRKELESKKDNLFAAAASHIRPERFAELVARACIANPTLLDCTRASLFTSAAQAASLGLEIGGPLGQCYLVPFKNRGVLEATLVPGYLGMKELAYRSGMIASIEYGVVRPGDEFDYQKGTAAYLNHKPSDLGTNGAASHVYAIVKTTTGGVLFEVMSWNQVESHRNKFSKGHTRADSAWQTNPMQMALKTVLRKTLKLAPLSAELQDMMQREEYAEQPAFQSGMEAAESDLDVAVSLLDGDNPAAATAEELADVASVGSEFPF